MSVSVHGADEAGASDLEVLEVWQAVFGPVGDVGQWTAEVWARHRDRADYRLGEARDQHGRLVGFSWGYTGQRGQFWSDLVAAELGTAVDGWLGGHFELVELAVLAEFRGRGIGAALHDDLLAGLPHERALLGTSADPTDPAVRLYESRGWKPLGLLRPGTQVMGKDLRVT